MKSASGLMLAGVVAVFGACDERQSPPPGVSYKTLNIRLSDRTLHSDYPATIQGRQDVKIYPQVSGLITQVCIGEGADVRKGQTLFVIDQTPYRAALETAEANVESAEANVGTAQMTAESKEELLRENVVSDFDLQQARAELKNARSNLSYTEIKSPVDGTAGMSSYRIGALVGPSIAAPLITVSDNAEMFAYFSMSEKQILALSRLNGSLTNALEAMPAVGLLLSDGSEYPHKGRIDAISGIVDASTERVTLRAVFPNPDHTLRSGRMGNIRLPYEKKGCIVIPQTATYEVQDKVFVYKVVGRKTNRSKSAYSASATARNKSWSRGWRSAMKS